MGTSEVRIDDDYILTTGSNLKEWYSDLQDGIDEYISIMEGIVGDAIMEGETAESLKEFLEFVKALSGEIEPIGEECEKILISYKNDVDQADDVLY